MSSAELIRIEELLAHNPQGLSAGEIQSQLAGEVTARTLHRRLQQLIREQHAIRRGAARSARYFSTSVRPVVPDSWPTMLASGPAYFVREPAIDAYIPLSSEAEGIRQQIQRPAMHRRPVGYVREFVDHYIPNVTRYMPERFLEQLGIMGGLPDGNRPAGTYARQILNRLLVDFSWASSRLEGNSYTYADTQKLIEAGEAARGRDAKETQMILNHKAAIEFLVDSAGETGVDRYTILNLHALLSEGLLGNPADEGRLRMHPVGIGGSVYSPPAIPQLIDEMFRSVLDKAAAIADPFEQSFFLMVHLPYLQPFIDVNKRTSRLAANIPLIQRNCVPLSFIAVPERSYTDGMLAVYELNRIELLRDVYLWAYERSCKRYRRERDFVPEPDEFKMRHRDALIGLVQAAVRGGVAADDAAGLRSLATPLVDAADLERFLELAVREIRAIHEGNIFRYRLRPLEFEAWRSAHGRS